MLDKNPETRITIPEIKVTEEAKCSVKRHMFSTNLQHCCFLHNEGMLLQLHPWVTENGASPLPLEEEHCTAVEVTEEEVQNSVKLIPSLSTVVSLASLPLCSLFESLNATVPTADWWSEYFYSKYLVPLVFTQ